MPFRFLRRQLKLRGANVETEQALEATLVRTVAGATELDAAVVLAFDAVYGRDGTIDPRRTAFVVSNDYVADLAARYPRLLFGASVHPFRRDAVAEIERCVARGAVLLKWLPITQAFNPADDRCFPVYDALAHFRLPLLSHTGWEHTLPRVDRTVASPALLIPALRRGVTVIAAHCGTAAPPGAASFFPEWMRLAEEYEHFYGDTAALSLPNRWHAYERLLARDGLRAKLIHGSDWPLPPVPNPRRVGLRHSLRLLREPNGLRRDILIKQRLGFDDAYWHRCATLIRRPGAA
ncbi:MAG: amidohydrolase family protein [Gemmatimonadaceae bacterium]